MKAISPSSPTVHVAIPSAGNVTLAALMYIAVDTHSPTAEAIVIATGVAAVIAVWRASYIPVFSSYKEVKAHG